MQDYRSDVLVVPKIRACITCFGILRGYGASRVQYLVVSLSCVLPPGFLLTAPPGILPNEAPGMKPWVSS